MKKTSTLLLAIGLTSCVTPNATVEDEAPVSAVSTPAPTEEVTAVAEVPKQPSLPVHNDGLRLPADILGLPQDDQLRSAPATPKDGKATVIARPPEE